jgi:hypothetical protein
MAIGGCSLERHLNELNSGAYSYTLEINGKGARLAALAEEINAYDWDIITLQQVSHYSGMQETYQPFLDELVAFIKENKPNAKLFWHKTWAYDKTSTHSGFANYDNDQMTMYNAILSAVQNKIVTNDRIVKIIPNGTAIQNARTSYIGDNFTRDGYHLAKPLGRFIAGLGAVETLIGIDWDKFDLEFLSTVVDDLPEDETLYFEMALESVKNAVAKPFEITQSAFTEKAE